MYNQSAIINLDLLQISIKLKELIQLDQKNDKISISDNVTLIKTHRKTTIFNEVYNVEINGLIVFELQCNPNKGLLDVDHAILRAKNEYLYTKNIYKYYKLLKKDMKFLFYKINAIDIAVDTPKIKGIDAFQYDYVKGKIDFVANPQVTATFKNSGTIEYFRVGSRKSDKFLRTYDKRKEISISNKRYILDYFDKNNFDPNIEVFRMEVSIKGQLMNKIICPDFIEYPTSHPSVSTTNYYPFLEEKTLSIIQDGEFLKSVYLKETDNFLKTYKTQEFAKKKRANLCKQKSALKLNFSKATFLLDKVKANAAKVTHKVKMLSKFLQECAQESKAYIYEQLSFDIAHAHNMEEWRFKKIDSWINETNRKLKNKDYQKTLSAFTSVYYSRVKDPILI